MIALHDESSLHAAIEDQAWSCAAALLGDSREREDVWLRTLARNLDSLRQHRPDVYAAFQACDSITDPAPSVASEEQRITDAFAAIDAARRSGRAVALAGTGDGRLLRALARFGPVLALGRQQEVDVIEPDPARLLGALAFTDLTGPRGPIEQSRFAWYIGDAWEAQLTDDLLSTPTKVPPQSATLAGADDRPDIEEGLSRALERLGQEIDARAARVADFYANRDDADLLAVLSPRPPRHPRVLLVTSQFTTVLQYSTSDSADAFRQLGWETFIVSEGGPWNLMTRHAIVAAIDDFRPDLVFQLDHLRHELGDAIPPALPFVCWIQDHLPNLATAAAGDSIGERDFVLTGGVYRYVGRYGYPRRQCVDMPKVARPPVLPTRWTHDREDLLYVSHWSSSPESIIVETCNRAREFGGIGAEAIMRACTGELTRVYADGGSIRSDLEVRGLVRSVFERGGERLPHDTERFFVDALFQRLNNALYRQQALLWAGTIADELGLKFGIYGNGWDKHPDLGRFARGVVRYGPDLEALTRQSKILLQLEPYACYTHQRMLDCVLAGGFALIRDHILNTLPTRIRKFLDANVPPEVNDVPTARKYFDAARTAAFDTLIAGSQIITDLGDPIEIIRGWQRAGIIGNGDEALPHLNDIKFDTVDTLRDRVRRFIDDVDGRSRISADQRASVMERLTYKSAIGRATATIYDRLREAIGAEPPRIIPAAEAA